MTINQRNLKLLLALLLALLLTACGGQDGNDDNDDKPPPLSGAAVMGVVKDASGNRLEGITVALADGSASAQTDARGEVTLQGLPADTALTVQLSDPEYAVQTVNVTTGEEGSATFFRATMLKRNDPVTITSIENGGEATGEDGVVVELPANALVDSAGNPVSGDVQVSMTPVNIADPDELPAFPGEFAGLDEGGGDAPLIVSYGAAEYIFEQDGEALELSADATATIELPFYVDENLNGSAVQAGDTIPLWYFDPDTGRWQQEGQGTVVASGESPTGFVLRGEVEHFTWWNIDVAPEPYSPIPDIRNLPDGTAVRVCAEPQSSEGPQTRPCTTVTVSDEQALPLPPDLEVCLVAEAVLDGKVYRGKTCTSGAAGDSGTVVIEMFEGFPIIRYFQATVIAGDEVTLVWDAIDADTLSIDQGVGDVTGSGSVIAPLSETTTFTLSASNENGTATAAVTARVRTGGDTSGYSGLLAWTVGTTGDDGVRVWDLAASSFVYDFTTIGEETYAHPELSADGSTLAYLDYGPELIGGTTYGVQRVTLVDLNSGALSTVPYLTGEPDSWRTMTAPSLTADGQTVAFMQFIHSTDDNGLPTSTWPDIALWSGSGQPRLLTDNGAGISDTCPTITANGQTVYFESDRDLEGGDLYRIDVATGAVERLTITSVPEIASLLTLGSFFECKFEVSDDGSMIAFGAKLKNDTAGLFVMDTSSGTITRVDEAVQGEVSLVTQTDFALSANGERLVFTTLETSPWIARLYAVELDNPGAPTLIKEDSSTVDENYSFPVLSPSWLALSDDGETIAALLRNNLAENDYEILAVMHDDGTTITDFSTVIDAQGTGTHALGVKDISF